MKRLLLILFIAAPALADYRDDVHRQADAMEGLYLQSIANSVHSASVVNAAGDGCSWTQVVDNQDESIYVFAHGAYRQVYYKQCEDDPKEVSISQQITYERVK